MKPLSELDFLTSLHKSTKRDYVQRVVEHDKAECAERAKQWDYDYWDGDRKYGFGGYHYDGRWRTVAEEIAGYYDLMPGQRVLDVGCGKAFLLYELSQVVPGIEVAGVDISAYGINNAKKEVKDFLVCGSATDLPWSNDYFDFVFSLNTLHNLKIYELMDAIREIQRVGNKNRYICVESYRNEREKANLLYWQLTCETFFSPEEWAWYFAHAGYQGDCGFIYFE
tara:strand:- start:160 stop:831 length:672 start_codon:yes stop_codon:yes gene_type:complete